MKNNSELYIEYRTDEQNIDKSYVMAFDGIFRERDKAHESMSEEMFLQPGGISAYVDIERKMPLGDDYFYEIAEIFEDDASLSEREEELKRLLTMGFCRLNDSNTYLIPYWHPFVLCMDEYLGKLAKDYNAFVDEDEDSDIYKLIYGSVLRDYIQNKSDYNIYTENQVYYSKKPGAGECRRAVPWDRAGALTEFDSLRLAGKVDLWARRHAEDAEENITVKIAYIGELRNIADLQIYLNRNTDKYKHKFQIEFTQLLRRPELGEYIFEINGSDHNEKRIFDLMSSTDLRTLYQCYNIFLLLDQSYFYKQWQSDKPTEEKTLDKKIVWYSKKMEKASSEREDASGYSFKIYEDSGLWLNGHLRDESAEFSFDIRLYETLSKNVSDDCDVYLYISKGESIGNINLRRQSLCNSERYDGKILYVYKLSGNLSADDKNASVESVSLGIDRLIAQDQVVTAIDFWKLIKSTGTAFSRIFINKLEEQSEGLDKYDIIRILTDSKLIITRNNNPKAQQQIRFRIQTNAGEDSIQSLLKEYAEAYLVLCKEENSNKYVSTYLKRLLSDAIVSRTESVEGLLCALLLLEGNLKFSSEIGEIEKSENIENAELYSRGADFFRSRRAAYSAIEGLSTVLIRGEGESRRYALNYDFRNIYCPDVNESSFARFVKAVHNACRLYDYKNSILYYVTG